MIYIETPRLVLRDWEEKDEAPFARMNADPRVMEFFLKRLSPEESYGFLQRIRKEFERYGYGLYAVERKKDEAFIGFTGFHRFDFDTDFAPGVEIGWRFLPEAWGNGYATEAARECLAYGADKLKLREIYSFTSLPNKRSERVMQKIEMKKVKEFGHPLVPENHLLYRHLLYQKTF